MGLFAFAEKVTTSLNGKTPYVTADIKLPMRYDLYYQKDRDLPER
jgi:hypothetical protein